MNEHRHIAAAKLSLLSNCCFDVLLACASTIQAHVLQGLYVDNPILVDAFAGGAAGKMAFVDKVIPLKTCEHFRSLNCFLS